MTASPAPEHDTAADATALTIAQPSSIIAQNAFHEPIEDRLREIGHPPPATPDEVTHAVELAAVILDMLIDEYGDTAASFAEKRMHPLTAPVQGAVTSDDPDLLLGTLQRGWEEMLRQAHLFRTTGEDVLGWRVGRLENVLRKKRKRRRERR